MVYTNNDLHIEGIKPDTEFIRENLEKAEKFFQVALLPELLGIDGTLVHQSQHMVTVQNNNFEVICWG